MDFLKYTPLNSWANLQKINNDPLIDFDKKERVNIEHNLTQGVKENIAAKTIK
jgi:hypothetical protein